jgi:hypothetical protein
VHHPVVGRPVMPAGDGPPDTVGGLLPWRWVESRLIEARDYWIATTGPGGMPHIAPVWGVWLRDGVWFGTDPASAKARNLARDDRVGVHLESGEEAVILYGRAQRLRLDDLASDVLDGLDAAHAAKYVDVDTGDPFRLSTGPADTLVCRVAPRRVVGWRGKDVPRTGGRWRFPDHEPASDRETTAPR